MIERIKRQVLLVVMLLGGISCSIDSDLLSPQSESDIIIRSGTSYGMCIGYCVRNLDLSGTQATYYMLSYNSDKYPYKTISGEISKIEWNALVAEIDDATIQEMKDVYGCPDCADGGAEWVEIVTKTYTKKITFEVSNVPEEIEILVAKLRAIRHRFNPDFE